MRGLRVLIATGLALGPLAAVMLPAAASASPLPTPTLGTPSLGTQTTVTTPSPAANPAAPLSVTLSSMRPLAPQPGDTLVLTGTISNPSTEVVSDLSVSLRMSLPLIARGEFDDYAADPTGALPTDMTTVAESAALPQTSLAPGAKEPFQISVPVNQLDLTTAWQVRELGIAVNGADTFAEGTVGQLRTFLPWAPRAAAGFKPVQLSWIWPLDDRPHRAVSATWNDDALAPELAPGGRLAALLGAASTAATQGSTAAAALAAANPPGHGRHHHKTPTSTVRNVPVTWAIDPMLIDDVTTMRNPYQVRGTSKSVPGTGTGAAKSWLAALRSAVGSGEVIPLPYADPDIAAAVRAGLSALVGVAETNGRALLAKTFPTANLLSTIWPPGGILDSRSLEALLSDGITSVVLSDLALPLIDPDAETETPSAHATLSTDAGELPALLTDSTLSNAVTNGDDSAAGTPVALTRFAAETLMIEVEAPNDQRDVVLAPGRRWTPTASYADGLLADSGEVPWIDPVPLSKVLNSPIDDVGRKPLTYPGSARRGELPVRYTQAVQTLQRTLAEFTNILPANNSTSRPYATALLRTLSSAWRSNSGRSAELQDVQSSLNSMMSAVHISSAQNSFVTLTSHDGKVPVSIANNLNTTVNVRVEIDANQRLTLAKGGRVGVQTIPAHQQITVNVHADAKTSGVFPLQVQLLTPNGHKYNSRGSRVQLYVRSTAYGTITLVITGAATVALLVAVAIRLGRRALAARRPTAAAP